MTSSKPKADRKASGLKLPPTKPLPQSPRDALRIPANAFAGAATRGDTLGAIRHPC
ncbi:hypothetical protein [Lysobacter gummosus]|uniref:hypothetical protein n=1 Tax=Lysobacter gummosus TaxID=262324 RepID=UPI003639CDEC